MEELPTCGKGLAQRSEIPVKLGTLIASLADNLDAHLPTIDVGNEAGRFERDAYASLINGFREIAERMAAISSEMAGYRHLPMAPHHDAALFKPRITDSFNRYVTLEGELANQLLESHARDLQLLRYMLGEN
jgi:hypothetical protein